MEGELLEMSNDFKDRIKEKNKEIAKLKHFIWSNGRCIMIKYIDFFYNLI